MGITFQTRELTEATKVLQAARTAKYTVIKQIRERLDAEFTGCRRCNGRGWVVVWDTMDSLTGCYAEYGSCKDEACTRESREASGINQGIGLKHDEFNSVQIADAADFANDEESAALDAAKAAYSDACDAEYSAKGRAVLSRGDSVVVIKGRKIAKGTEGRVFWTGKSNYGGYRIGMELSDGEKVFTAMGNIDKL